MQVSETSGLSANLCNHIQWVAYRKDSRFHCIPVLSAATQVSEVARPSLTKTAAFATPVAEFLLAALGPSSAVSAAVVEVVADVVVAVAAAAAASCASGSVGVVEEP